MKLLIGFALVMLCACARGPGPVKRKMIGLIEKFDRWDYNGDGRLNAKELNEAERVGGFEAREIIDFYDTNGDRLISLREAQDGILRLDEAKQIVEDKKNEQ